MPHTHKNNLRYFLCGLIIILIAVFIDQYTKWFVFEQLLRISGDAPDFATWLTTKKDLMAFFAEKANFTNHKINGFLDFVMVWNQGISFGLFSNGSETGMLIFIGISCCISLGLLIWMAKCDHPLNSVAIALIIGGAIGNVIDRIRFGAVADFIDLHYNDTHWPAFNVADICVCFGAFLVVLYTLFFEKDENAPVDV